MRVLVSFLHFKGSKAKTQDIKIKYHMIHTHTHTHQIPPHLAFCTPGQNQKAKPGTNLETLKRNKQTQKQLHIS